MNAFYVREYRKHFISTSSKNRFSNIISGVNFNAELRYDYGFHLLLERALHLVIRGRWYVFAGKVLFEKTLVKSQLCRKLYDEWVADALDFQNNLQIVGSGKMLLNKIIILILIKIIFLDIIGNDDYVALSATMQVLTAQLRWLDFVRQNFI